MSAFGGKADISAFTRVFDALRPERSEMSASEKRTSEIKGFAPYQSSW